jgi:large subunit ribosomal protein L17
MMGARRDATLNNMVKSLFRHQRIETTLARAKEARRVAEPLITLSKNDTVSARQRAFAILTDRDLVGKLFKEIAPLYKSRTSGYTRIIHAGFRRGDGATMAILELTDRKIVEKLPRKAKKEKAQAGKPEAKAEKPAAPETATKERPEKKQAPKDEQNIKHIPKAKPTLEVEKAREKAKSEEKKISTQQGFMKNIRGLFRKRGDR